MTVAVPDGDAKRAKPGWKPYLQRPATEKQMKYLEDLVESGVVAQSDVDSLGDEPNIADVNALLNSHPEGQGPRAREEGSQHREKRKDAHTDQSRYRGRRLYARQTI